MRIPASKEAALEAASAVQSDITVFSDGSSEGGHVGAAAVLYRNGVERRVLRKHLGTDERHTVFEAEVLGMSLAVELIKMESSMRSVSIGIDSQAAILATRHIRGTLGQYLVDVFHEQMQSLCSRHAGIDVELRWMPGHLGILGHEQVDKEAKKAALGESSR